MTENQASELQVGSVVQLNSGGPFMTVVDLTSSDLVKVVYYDEVTGTFLNSNFYGDFYKLLKYII